MLPSALKIPKSKAVLFVEDHFISNEMFTCFVRQIWQEACNDDLPILSH